MRVYVTGATGFVGRWLEKELTSAGHEVVAAPDPDQLDVADLDGLVRWLSSAGTPDAVVHLAGVAFARDACEAPAEAFRINVGGTMALFEALRSIGLRPPVLVSGSADVYGDPSPEDLPLTEQAVLRPVQPYAISKAAQEATAIAAAVRYGFPVVVARSFNHAGPGQRPVFVVPAMAQRVLAMRRGEAAAVPTGNIDVRRDITDVRDVVRAYRLLLEGSAEGRLGTPPLVVNVASGRAVSVRWIVEQLCAMVGRAPIVRQDPTLVRQSDPKEICGDASLLTSLTGWRPTIPLEQTLADVLDDARTRLHTPDQAGGTPA